MLADRPVPSVPPVGQSGAVTVERDPPGVPPGARHRDRCWSSACRSGQSAVYAVVSLIAKLTADGPLSKQTASLNTSQSARPWLDLTYQLLGIFFALLPVLLAVHLLGRDPGDPARALGLDAAAARVRPGPGRRPGRADRPARAWPLFWAAAQLGLNATLVPAGLPPRLVGGAGADPRRRAERRAGGGDRGRLPGHPAAPAPAGGSPRSSRPARCCAAPTTSTRASARSSATP